MAKQPKKSKAPTTSTRPRARPTSAPTTSTRPRTRPSDGGAVARGNRAREREERESEGLRPKKKMTGGKMGTKKYAKGGMTRGCGAATKGKSYSRAG